jgi:hypothetical protein
MVSSSTISTSFGMAKATFVAKGHEPGESRRRLDFSERGMVRRAENALKAQIRFRVEPITPARLLSVHL